MYHVKHYINSLSIFQSSEEHGIFGVDCKHKAHNRRHTVHNPDDVTITE